MKIQCLVFQEERLEGFGPFLRLFGYYEEGRVFDQCQATVLPALKLASVEFDSEQHQREKKTLAFKKTLGGDYSTELW